MTETASRTPKKKLPRICVAIYLLTAISGILYVIFTQNAAFSDWFNLHVSAWGRQFLSFFTTHLPFSIAEALLLLIPVFLVLLIGIGVKHFCDSNRSALVYVGILFSVLCVVGILFVWNFAAGYYGTTLDQKLGLERKKSSADDLYQTAELLSDELTALSDEIVFLPDGSSLMPYSYQEMNQKLLVAFERYCEKQDFIHHFSSQVKPIMLSEPMSYTHITGVYTFFTGEANINVNFPDYTVVYTAAHELAHQRGIAREDEANFIAFLICMESDDPYIRYCGYLNVYEYLASALYSADKELYKKSYGNLHTDVREELAAYRLFFQKYQDNVAADISQATNNAYLQSQGSPEGTRSYNMVVDLAVAYYRTHPDWENN